MTAIAEHDMQRVLRRRIAVFVAATLVSVVLLGVAWDFARTLQRLEVVERERDAWQRPAEIVQALDVHEGDIVVDLGCGSGYFALKLASAVGETGEVLALDIRRLPLAFLWARTVGTDSVRVAHVGPEDPALPIGTIAAVLVANTYHELEAPDAVLDHLFEALRPGGRLVVVDRGPRPDDPGHADADSHASSAESVDRDLRRHGFTILERRDSFIDVPGDDAIWWLIVARRSE